jgi:hypothetical protein
MFNLEKQMLWGGPWKFSLIYAGIASGWELALGEADIVRRSISVQYHQEHSIIRSTPKKNALSCEKVDSPSWKIINTDWKTQEGLQGKRPTLDGRVRWIQ